MAELSQNAILRISDDKTLKLIELYERESCLWDTRSPLYKNREKRARAAELIARELHIKHFEARHVLMKFKNLRNSYLQELKKIAKSVEAGEEVYKPTVIWFKKMDSFLRPHLQPGRGAGGGGPKHRPHPTSQQTVRHEDLNIKIEPETYFFEVTDNGVETTQAEPELLLSSVYSGDSHKDHELHVDRSDTEDYLSEVRSNKSKKRRRCSSFNSSKRLRDRDNQNEQLSQTLNQISGYLQSLSSQQEDHYDSFGKYVAALLRSLSPQTAMELQPKIISLFIAADVGKGDRNGAGKEVGGGS